jgi:hypothetical protein
MASDVELTAGGTDACPPGGIVGRGKIDVDTGSLTPSLFPRIIHTDVTNFNNANESILFAESTNFPGAQTRTVTRAHVTGNTITTDTPTFPGVPPPDPYLALKSFRLSVKPLTRAGRSYVITPPSCPSEGYWTFTFTSIYRDGVRETAQSYSPCNLGSHAHCSSARGCGHDQAQLVFAVKPRRVAAGRATRFHFSLRRRGGHAAAGAVITFCGRRTRTNGQGRATIVCRSRRPGRYLARAKTPGVAAAVVWVRVARPPHKRVRERHS